MSRQSGVPHSHPQVNPSSVEWVPAHIGIAGNELADGAARDAHASHGPTTTFITRNDVARLYIARSTRELHPDPRVAAGKGPRPLPDEGLARRDRSLLLRLRIGCYRTAERLHRLTGGGSPLCADCADEETLQHLLLKCPCADNQRRVLLATYGRLGLPRTTIEHLLFPACAKTSAVRAFAALLEFIEAAGQRGRF
ncbi:hypothetical protein HPB50_013715 [Hyalomma asiaticum]|uniref:Uncharacterized protein n=1 Tax=Hyalomma asiaticum TaxID=266040 RepID=A0ACB7THR7_HYAAI|nr:hypothetical protein HPB50_013715 [Hyalomma asiaticum]